MRGCLTWKMDPGPCPVDDTPHTACTPESVDSLTVTVRRPRVLDRAPEALTPVTAFSTKTYQRKVHGEAMRKARGRRD